MKDYKELRKEWENYSSRETRLALGKWYERNLDYRSIHYNGESFYDDELEVIPVVEPAEWNEENEITMWQTIDYKISFI